MKQNNGMISNYPDGDDWSYTSGEDENLTWSRSSSASTVTMSDWVIISNISQIMIKIVFAPFFEFNE